MVRMHAVAAMLLVFMGGSFALATEQRPNGLNYAGRQYFTTQAPMFGLWHYEGDEPPQGKLRAPAFDVESSANWSGYEATWEIRDRKLWLRDIRGKIKGSKVQNDEILVGKRFPVHARWFTGKIYMPVGQLSDDGREFEAVIVFYVEEGNVKSLEFFPSMRPNYSWNGM